MHNLIFVTHFEFLFISSQKSFRTSLWRLHNPIGPQHPTPHRVYKGVWKKTPRSCHGGNNLHLSFHPLLQILLSKVEKVFVATFEGGVFFRTPLYTVETVLFGAWMSKHPPRPWPLCHYVWPNLICIVESFQVGHETMYAFSGNKHF